MLAELLIGELGACIRLRLTSFSYTIMYVSVSLKLSYRKVSGEYSHNVK